MKTRASTLFAALLACCATAALADVGDVATATATFSGLSYTLVDLDPNDGITPWIQFHDNYVLQGFNQNYVAGQFNSQAGNVFSASAGAISATGLQASSTPGANTTSSQLTAANIQNLQQAPGAQDPTISYQGAVVVSSHGTGLDTGMNVPVPLPGEFSWTLSPHTLLLIQGTASGNASVNLSQLAQGALRQDVADNLYGVTLSSSAILVAQLLTNGYTVPDTGEIIADRLDELQFIVSVEQSLSRDGLSVPDGGVLTDSRQQVFSIQMANDSSLALDGDFFFGNRSEALLVATPALTTEVPSIPEPSTYALMGLGWGLMAWRVRTARRR